PVARRKGTGVIAMKVYGHGELERRELALRYSLGLPGVSLAILGMKTEAEIDENVRLAQECQPLTQDELDTLIEDARDLIHKDKPSEDSPLFWLYDTKSMAWQEDSEPVLVAY
ncbi:MAG TPA: hypothetical protein VEW94_00760, partial [Chloroflexia bacterium]|nr:hypothetical protein [Chloroflexia bacterium]